MSTQLTPSNTNLRMELKSQSYHQLIELFKRLPPADVTQLQGEVEGCTLASKNIWGNIITWLSTHTPFPGTWIGKGFQAIDEKTGIGYNRFKCLGIEHKSMRFITKSGVSDVDKKPVLLMDYKPCNNPLGWLNALDEIRQIDENNYLLCGHWTWPLLGKSQFLMYHIHGPIITFKD